MRAWLARSFRNRTITAGLLIALGVNLVLAAAYVWSRGGQTSTVRVTVRGDSYTASIDGRQRADTRFDGPATGGVMLMLTDSEALPSLPKPRGIDSVVIRDRANGRVLFKDDFDNLDDGTWQVLAGSFAAKDGVLTADSNHGPTGPARELPAGLGVTTAYSDCPTGYADRRICGYGRSILLLRDQTLRDYEVEVRYRNSVGGFVAVRVDDSRRRGVYDGVYYGFSTIRDLGNDLALIRDNTIAGSVPGGLVHLRREETIKSLTAMAVAPYPYLLLFLVAGTAVVLALSLAPAGLRVRPLPARTDIAVIVALLVAAFGVTLFINGRYNTFVPHVPDEVAYIFQAKLFTAGHVTGKIPPVQDAFNYWATPFLYTNGDRWASFYPFGHPLVLAIGEAVGAMWLVPSLVGAACVGMVFLIGRRMYDTRTAVLAAALLASSPFFLMLASNYMSHNTAALYLLVSLFFLLKRDVPVRDGLIAGLAFGLLFNTRPLTALALVLPFGVLVLSNFLSKTERRAGLLHTAAFIVGGLVMLGAYLGYNYVITSDPFKNPYTAGGDISVWLGFGGRHSLDIGLQNEQADLSALLLVFNGWPLYLGLMFVLLPFMTGTRNRWDYLCLSCALLQASSLVLYEAAGIMYGPRYWYESLPFWILLTARGVECAALLLIDLAAVARSRLAPRLRAPPAWAGALVTYVLVGVFVVYGTGGWLFGFHEGWEQRNVPFVSPTASGMREMLGMDNRLIKLSREEDIGNALVLVEPCHGWWACYGSVFWLNSVHFDGDIVWARDIGPKTQELIDAYPGRQVYYATWDPPTLRPYRSSRAAE